MKINLKKSAVIQQEILSAIKILRELKFGIEFNEFHQDIESQLNEKRNECIANQKLITDLYSLYYSLRTATAHLNHDVGINKLLGDIELAKKLLEVEQSFNKMTPAMNLVEINSRLDKIRNANEKSYYYEKTVDTNCITLEDKKLTEQNVSKLRQKIRELGDRLLELNTQTKLSIEPQQYEILVNAGIYS